MVLETRQSASSSNFSSNARDVERLLLQREGRAVVYGGPHNFSIEIIATYSQPPLGLATKIAELMRDEFLVNRVITYYRSAHLSRRTFEWCLHIYKVRDLLCKHYRGERRTRKALAISGGEWSDFGSLLNNNDLRHADVSGTPPMISHTDVNWLFDISRQWIAKFIRTKGVEAIV